MNSYKITNLADPIIGTDAVNLQFADSRYVIGSSIPLNEIPPPIGNVDFAGYKLINLGDATVATDALNRESGDNRYYLNSTPINYIIAPNDDVSMNNHKVTNLATPTLSNDATTKQYVDDNAGISESAGDARYYLNTTTLDTIVNPTSSVSLNNQKITNLGNATFATDALNRVSADTRYYLNNTTLDAI